MTRPSTCSGNSGGSLWIMKKLRICPGWPSPGSCMSGSHESKTAATSGVRAIFSIAVLSSAPRSRKRESVEWRSGSI